MLDAPPAYRLARGVRLRLASDGASLLVPEGIVSLSETAAAILELVDGTRDAATIATLLAERFDAPPGELARDVGDMLAALRERGFLQL